mmetsp:Transcript_115966/g.322966  ORF Transcript_115966/g.322966 Transcript_115966/m.322966 type:complete len:241 (+) Transcript_115966:531-1253(+)
MRHRPDLGVDPDAFIGQGDLGSQTHVHVEILQMPRVVWIVSHNAHAVGVEHPPATHVFEHSRRTRRVCDGPMQKLLLRGSTRDNAHIGERGLDFRNSLEVPEDPGHHELDEEGGLAFPGLLVLGGPQGVRRDGEADLVHAVCGGPILVHRVGAVHTDVPVSVGEHAILAAGVHHDVPLDVLPVPCGCRCRAAADQAQFHSPADDPNIAWGLHFEVCAGSDGWRHCRSQGDEQQPGPHHWH